MGRVLLVLASLLLPSLAPARPCEPRPFEAETIYRGGTIQTLDKHFTRGEALAVAGGRVLGVGREEVMSLVYAGCGTRFVDLRGNTLLPGLVDAHTHTFQSVFWVYEELPSEEQILDDMAESQEAQLRVGITTQAEALAGRNLRRLLLTLREQGRLHLRTTLYLGRTQPNGTIADFQVDQPQITDVEAQPRQPGIKIFADGTTHGELKLATTFTQKWPDRDQPFYGDLYFDQQTMDDLIRLSDADGWQILIHALGDAARDEVLASYSSLLEGEGKNPLRHRIEHNTITRPEQIDAMAELGIVPVVFGNHFTCSVQDPAFEFMQWLPEKGWYQPYRSMFDRGLRVAWHGDWHASQVIHQTPEALSTWFGGLLFSLVTRAEIVDGEVCLPEPWFEAERVSIQQALRMMFANAAYAIGMESVVASLEPGKLADLMIVSGDPLQVDEWDLKDIRVLATIIGDVPRSCAPGSEEFCP
jgi:predicted amidohydrolase YtcJ